MRLGIISDTHDELVRTRFAIRTLLDLRVDALVHCGDLASPPIVAACAVLPCWFVFGNHDADSVPALEQAAQEHGVNCLGWGGIVELVGKRIGVAHGHLTSDVARVLSERPDYFLFGHTHVTSDEMIAGVRRLNPGALFRAENFTAAILELASGHFELVSIARYPGLPLGLFSAWE